MPYFAARLIVCNLASCRIVHEVDHIKEFGLDNGSCNAVLE